MEHVNYSMKHSPERSPPDSRCPLALKNAGPAGTLVLSRKPAPLTIRHHTTPHPHPGWDTSVYYLFIFGCAGSCCCAGFAPAAASGGYSRHSARASHCLSSRVAGHGLWGSGSVVVAPGFHCALPSRIFLAQVSNPCLLRWQADSLPLSHQ